jgi:hypothetical protein
VELVRRKNTQIQSLRVGVLTISRNLLTQAASMSDYKRFVVAIGSGEVQGADRVMGACIKQKRGIRGMFDTYLRAAKGVYNPANSEEADMVGLTIWKLAGIRVAEIAHRALGLPGVTTLRTRMITPPLTASPGAPQVWTSGRVPAGGCSSESVGVATFNAFVEDSLSSSFTPVIAA